MFKVVGMGEDQGSTALQDSGKVTAKSVGGSDGPMGRQETQIEEGERGSTQTARRQSTVWAAVCRCSDCLGASKGERSAAAFRVPRVESKTMR